MKATTNFDEALRGKDVVMMLRMQLERQKRGLFSSLREYYLTFGLTEERLALAAQGRHRHAPRPHEPRRGDRLGGGRRPLSR